MVPSSVHDEDVLRWIDPCGDGPLDIPWIVDVDVLIHGYGDLRVEVRAREGCHEGVLSLALVLGRELENHGEASA